MIVVIVVVIVILLLIIRQRGARRRGGRAGRAHVARGREGRRRGLEAEPVI